MSNREKKIVIVCSVLIGVLLMAGLAVGINNAGNTPAVESLEIKAPKLIN